MNQYDNKVFADPGMLAAHGDGGAEARVLGEIERLGLEKNAWELDTLGYTVLTPEQVAPPEFAQALRDRILDASEAITGVRPDLTLGATHTEGMTNIGRSELLGDVFFSDPIFEQALMNERVLAIVTYLLGESCVVVAMNGVIKGPGPEHTPLHADSVQPNPLPAYSQQCNATWLLTDYDEASGATLFEPGSHKKCRNPTAEESADLSATHPLIAPAGSVAIWHGNTWHAALPRTVPGLRLGLLTFFHRVYLRPPKESFSGRVTEEMLARNSERFAKLTGAKDIDRYTECLTRHSQFA